ncbi:hypothetical protein [Sandaracinus amylolyticus]|uniref:hypothetical protein n=1 Tax=Sandaracinus amylolyticus TaxID=927083 RepID=UPI001F44E173|nr:hypothetical protein [Sandaracinus amylolyticus]UJR78801.1 Tryptophan synthase alpha chain [Sandaracinus amylolyticus]
MVKRSFVLALALIATLTSCSNTTPRTQVMVVVDTDLRGPLGIDNVIATVIAPGGEVQMANAQIGAGQPDWPRTLALVWEEGRRGLFTVRLSGNRGGALLVQRTQRFTFQEGRTLMLRMDLFARCAAAVCGSEQTCGENGCRAIDVAPSELTEWSGTPAPFPIDASVSSMDASVPIDAPIAVDAPPPIDAFAPPDAPPDVDSGPPIDSCIVATETCNTRDDDCDGTTDEGFDLDVDEANCGTCGVACDFRNSTGECMAGFCEIAACDANFEDCNLSGLDGCEIDLQSDEMHCGACGNRCNVGPARVCCRGVCARDCL